MIRYFLYISFIVFFAVNIQAQQLAVFEGVHDVYELLNPGARDNNYLVYNDWGQKSKFKSPRTIGIFYKNQWLGQDIEGSPTNLGIKVNFTNNNRWLWGGSLLQDRIGAFRKYDGYFRGAFNLFGGQKEYDETNNDVSLNLGIGIYGNLRRGINNNGLTVFQELDPIYTNSQSFIPSFSFGTSFGLYGHFTLKSFRVIYGGGILRPTSKENIIVAHEFANLGVIWNVSKSSALEFLVTGIKSDPLLSMDFFLRYHHSPKEFISKSFASMGIGYRRDVFLGELFFFLKDEKIRLGFIFDLFHFSLKNMDSQPIMTITMPSIELQCSFYF